MRIDAHHHLWALSRGGYDWPTPDLAPLYHDFAPQDLQPLLDAGRIDAAIVVQAAPTEAETAWLLACAADHHWIAGVVGWTDLAAPDAPARIAELARAPKLRGVRPMLQDMADRDWIARPELSPALAALSDHALVFDALVRPDQLGAIATIADRHPGLSIVIDHAAKPRIGSDLSEWTKALRAVASRRNVHVKLSGLMTEAPAEASIETLRPVTDIVLAAFGSERTLWGSDWPVVLLAAGYDHWLSLAEALVEHLDEGQRADIFGGNAARLYRIAP